MCGALGVDGPGRGSSPAALYAPGFDRARIAGLGPRSSSPPRNATRTSVRQILRPGGVGWGTGRRGRARAFQWRPGTLPVAAAGAFFLSAPVVLESLVETLSAAGFEAAVCPVPEPVRGAVVAVLAGRAYEAGGSA